MIIDPGQYDKGVALALRFGGPAKGAEGHCEGMDSIAFRTAAFDWLARALP